MLVSLSGVSCIGPLLSSPGNFFINLLYFILLYLSFSRFVYPFLRAYSTAGHFKRVDKVREAVQQHLVTLTIALVVGLFALFYLVAVKRVDGYFSKYFYLFIFYLIYLYLLICRNAIIGMAMAAANAWGMFMLVVLLGLGLVDIPRSMWRKANRFLMLKFVSLFLFLLFFCIFIWFFLS